MGVVANGNSVLKNYFSFNRDLSLWNAGIYTSMLHTLSDATSFKSDLFL